MTNPLSTLQSTPLPVSPVSGLPTLTLPSGQSPVPTDFFPNSSGAGGKHEGASDYYVLSSVTHCCSAAGSSWRLEGWNLESWRNILNENSNVQVESKLILKRVFKKTKNGQEEIESNTGSQRDVWDKIDLAELPSDLGLRTPIANNNVNKEFEDSSLRRFKTSWFNDFPDWLEYIIAKDAIFCFYCYLFKPNSEEHGGGDSFIDGGFSNWKKKERLQSGSAHNRAQIKYEAFVNQKQNIDCVLFKKSKKTKDEYRIHLNASINCVRLLLRQGLSFRGHDESENSRNQGNFLEFLQWLCDHNKEIKDVCLSNAPENLQLTSPKIQKDIVSAIAFETLDVIMRDIGDRLFFILVDESRDVSVKEQMFVVLRYVNQKGQVTEHFIGVEHVSSTTALSLKNSIDHLFSRLNLSISSLRGQGYDGARNMRGEYNGLKALILKENPSAFYIHCFVLFLEFDVTPSKLIRQNHLNAKNLSTRCKQ
ncbi:zinc finger MYM-type protein 1-like [Olea europaea var. sylvestris]|uniref:zinc finger MYM-type protein 1-like n=1 Tax=Olea europaea var. sylvestris TaxID=158386 RepID=UPI000C1CF33E|nr:zinc finger MYM-type protein 1-like [Olea europaea var. sylvestris]